MMGWEWGAGGPGGLPAPFFCLTIRQVMGCKLSVQGEQLTKEQTMNAGSIVGKLDKLGRLKSIGAEEAQRLAALHDCMEHHTRIDAPGTATEAFMSSNPSQPHLVIIVAKDAGGQVSYSGVWINGQASEEDVFYFMGDFSELVSSSLNRAGIPTGIELATIDKKRN